MPTTFNAIYLGNGGTFNIDPTEGSSTSENAVDLVGLTSGSPEDPLFERIVSVTATDQRGTAGVLDTNRGLFGAQDQVTYTLPGASSSTTAVFEGLAVYDATVTFFDGSTGTVTAVVFQDEAGNVFVAPEVDTNADSDVYQSGPITSMTLSGLVSNSSNLSANRNAADFITCFVAGTMIETPDGPRRVEDLSVGDRVLTVDAGEQVLRWVGARGLDVCDADNLKPIRIRTGALGQGLPNADLLVSPQHRVLVRSAVAQRMFGTNEVLVAAKQLTALPGIEVVDDATQVTYVHLLFDDHQLVTSNGAVSESLFTGPQALKGVSDEARAEILALFPDLAEIGADMELRQPARPLVPGRQGRKLAERHLANQKPIIG